MINVEVDDSIDRVAILSKPVVAKDLRSNH